MSTPQRKNKFSFTVVYSDGTTWPCHYPTQEAMDLAAEGYRLEGRTIREVRPEDPIFLGPASGG